MMEQENSLSFAIAALPYVPKHYFSTGSNDHEQMDFSRQGQLHKRVRRDCHIVRLEETDLTLRLEHDSGDYIEAAVSMSSFTPFTKLLSLNRNLSSLQNTAAVDLMSWQDARGCPGLSWRETVRARGPSLETAHERRANARVSKSPCSNLTIVWSMETCTDTDTGSGSGHDLCLVSSQSRCDFPASFLSFPFKPFF
jgi:hypothetical protein